MGYVILVSVVRPDRVGPGSEVLPTCHLGGKELRDYEGLTTRGEWLCLSCRFLRLLLIRYRRPYIPQERDDSYYDPRKNENAERVIWFFRRVSLMLLTE